MTETKYPFELVRYGGEGGVGSSVLFDRPFVGVDTSFEAEASRFVPGEQLELAINTAIAVGEPLLITGEPGTGKTQSAYYTAYKLGVEPVLHFQVKSDSTAKDLLYHFDAVRYFHDAAVSRGGGGADGGAAPAAPLDKRAYVEKRSLWCALESDMPRVLLIDEIDKAPRDFPNDLLHEIDKMEFTVSETQQVVKADKRMRPIVFITSNSERRLPEPFLRRCVYHHIQFDEKLLRLAAEKRTDEYSNLSEEFINLAVARFMAIRERVLNKRPSTSEFLVWLRVLANWAGAKPDALKKLVADLEDPSRQTPFPGVLLKNEQDLTEV